MPEPTAVPDQLLDFARSPGQAKLDTLLDPSATVNINMRSGAGAELVAALSGLDPAQRAGLTVIGGAGRSALIAPARTGQPHTRKLIVFSHPEGLVTEIAAYTDDHAAESARGSGPALAGTRAFPAALPHQALTAQRVLVSASTDALGLAVASAFVAAGASVVFHGRRAAFDLPEATGQATVGYVSADLAEPEGADYLAEQAASALGGPVTVLVNNLGPWDGTPVSQVSPTAWQQALQAGLTAQLRLAQLVAPGMREAGRGRIVNITAASAAKHNHGTYGFVKAALAFLTEALAVELAPEITVNSVAPGQIEESVPLMNSLDPVAVPAMLALTPLGRFVTRAEFARAIVTIATSAAFDMMTGASIPLGGGYHLACDEGA
jgi:NAD(P)-dependent dehydrogenase (short-subunit alcohol dehydrogenase family)